MSARVRFLAGGITGGHIGPPLHGVGSVWEPTGIGAERCLSRRGGTEPAPYRGSGGVRGGVWSPRPTGATQVVRSSGPMYLGHGFRRPNFAPKFGASVMGIGPYAPRGTGERHAESSCPTESPINHPSQPARSEASAPAAARDGRESTQRPSQKGKPAATAGAALSEAESAERAAGQIRSLPDTLRVQHGVLSSEICGKSRPCSRWHYLN